MLTQQKPNPNLIEESDLPKGWEDSIVDRPPVAVSGAPPPERPGMDRYVGGALPPILGLDSDLARSQIAGSMPVHRLMPIPSAGLAQSNAATGGNVPINQSVIAAAKAAAAAQTQATSAIAGVVALQATSFLGAYSSTFTYSQGASVDSGGTIYVSLVNNNLNHTPASSPTQWVATGGSNTSVFLGNFNPATTYAIGNQVTSAGGYYISLINGNVGNSPASSPSDWQLISSTNTEIYDGTYNGATAYVPGNSVSYQGQFYICVSNSTGNTPSTTSSFWTLLGTQNILIGNYSGAVTYTKTQEVVGTDGNIYQCIVATSTGSAPPSANWSLIGPATLNSVADGTSKFGQTGSGLSYAPTSNPLTGSDAGSSATVSVAAFTMRTSSKGDISDNSGSVTALSYSTLYYIYYDDPTLAGGAVSYSATVTKAVAINGSGRFFVGSIQTPAALGSTVGNSDGGASAQIGMTAVVFTTTFSGTYGTASATGGNGIATSANPSLSETWTGIVPASNDLMCYSKVLSVRSSCTITGIGNALLKYSLNGGTGFTTIYNTSSTLASQVYTITLPSGQDLTQVQVFGQVNYSSGAGTHVNQLVSGISVTEIS
jgi:hypothetical protein